MYSLKCYVLVFLSIAALYLVLGDAGDNRKDRIDPTFIPLPVNSKFWNPQLDDKTNMELIGMHLAEDSNETVSGITGKSGPVSGRSNLRSDEDNPTDRRGERYFAWGLFNLLRPAAWAGGLQDASLRKRPKSLAKGPN